MQVLFQVLTLFLLMMCGLLAVKTRMIGEKGISGLNMVVLYFAQPCLIAVKMQQDASPELILDLCWVFVAGFASMALFGLIGWRIFRRETPARRSVLAGMTTLSNAGFMGYPVITAALGEGALIYAVIYVSAFQVAAWTVCAYFFGGKKAMQPRQMLTNPSLIAVVIGLVLFLTGWRLPSFISSGMDMMGATTTPLSMFVIGSKLISLRLSHLKDKSLLTACLLRLVVYPLCLLPILRLLGLSTPVIQAVYLCTAMPAAALVAMQSELYHSDTELASRGVALSTALSMGTIPLLLLLI